MTVLISSTRSSSNLLPSPPARQPPLAVATAGNASADPDGACAAIEL